VEGAVAPDRDQGVDAVLFEDPGGLLLALLVLPFYIPTLIFGITAISAALMSPDGFTSSFLILSAISLVAMVLGPAAAAAALRQHMQ
jgi:heme exporter protein B